jgi:hypothetical protein
MKNKSQLVGGVRTYAEQIQIYSITAFVVKE